jgi:hypothetical protein
MMVTNFVIQPPMDLALIPLLILVATGVFVIMLAYFTGKHAKSIRQTFVALIIIGIGVISFGIWLYLTISTSSTINIESGYINIESPDFVGTGNLNFTTEDIKSAYVTQIGTGNITITLRQHGTSFGNYNLGVFTLGNGATAYIISNNQTVIVVQLNSGKYLILGATNIDQLIQSFSELVYPLPT